MGKTTTSQEISFFRPLKILLANMKTAICLLLVAMLAGLCLSQSKKDDLQVKQVAETKAARMNRLKKLSDPTRKMILRKQRAYDMKAKRADLLSHEWDYSEFW